MELSYLAGEGLVHLSDRDAISFLSHKFFFLLRLLRFFFFFPIFGARVRLWILLFTLIPFKRERERKRDPLLLLSRRDKNLLLFFLSPRVFQEEEEEKIEKKFAKSIILSNYMQISFSLLKKQLCTFDIYYVSILSCCIFGE